ncbi:MAG: DinB family protein [Planctomycetes bacterium]|nr:DinB family protein [Planctomycetota bacterium]
MDATTSLTALDLGLLALEQSRTYLLKCVDDMSDTDLLHRPAETGNHALWVMGHIAWSDDFFLQQFTKAESGIAPEEWGEKFGMGSSPTSDPDDYPTRLEIMEVMDKTRAALIAWCKTQSDEQLGAEVPAEWKGFARNFGMLMTSVAWHEGIHTGQVLEARRSLDMKPMYG